MMYFRWCLLVSAVLLFHRPLLPAQAPAHSGNAAVQYWQAFAHLPALDAHTEKVLSNWQNVTLDDTTAKLLQSGAASLQYLQRATQCKTCQWDLHYEDGPVLLIPHLAKCRTLAQLAALQLRSDLTQGKKAEGVSRCCAILTLARHAGNDSLLISILVGFKIEEIGFDAIAPHLLSLGEQELNHLVSYTGNLPAFASIQSSIGAEKEYMLDWLVRNMDAAEKQKPGSWKTIWVNILNPNPDPQDTLHQKLNRIESYAEVRKLATDFAPVYDQLQQSAALPFAEQGKRVDAILDAIRQNNLLGAWLLPAFQKSLMAEHRQRARLRLFQAALAIAIKGQDQLNTFIDPYGTGPFEYKALASGFELTSKLAVQGKPVSYPVGK